ncbi:MAG: 50S ribosomal protein L4 [Nitrospinae bacterium RIFCSPLOWO2_12_FULL_47_7]|nr:MAG: 50S ribosomal protein L4 [Nitrospinae bacterium RIFCSPLOWO2_12_FULL_47_7]
MPELDILDIKNKKVGVVQVSAEIFDAKIREHLVQKYVDMQLAARRRGTAKTKSNYAEVRGGGKKPWKQKGTGRARVGSSRSSLWRGGVTIFGPTPRSYAFKMTKKTKELALKSVLTDRIQNSAISVVDKLILQTSKTKEAVNLLKSLGLPEKTLFLLAEKNPNLELAIRNLPRVDVLLVDGLNAFDLLVHDKIVCTPEALKKIEERLN